MLANKSHSRQAPLDNGVLRVLSERERLELGLGLGLSLDSRLELVLGLV